MRERQDKYKWQNIIAHIVDEEKTVFPFFDWLRVMQEHQVSYRFLNLEDFKKEKQVHAVDPIKHTVSYFECPFSFRRFNAGAVYGWG